ncbi:MAG: hypothetical protein WC849_01725 [Candidatus Paceibacterota bacterium]
MHKKYVLFVISDRPLNLGKELIEKLSDDVSTQHFIYEDLDLNGGLSGTDEMYVEKNLPLHSRENDAITYTGRGEIVSMVIISFLKDMVRSVFGYLPHYRKGPEQKQKTVEAMLKTDSGG